MSSQTKAARTIINNIARNLEAQCVTYPEVMMECILDDAQELVNDGGYAWDVALSLACKTHSCTKYAGQGAYAS